VTRIRPVSPEVLAAELAERLLATPGLVRVAIDGAPALKPGALASGVADRLRTAGRFALPVSTEDFLLPASQRYEFGRTSPEAFYEGWRDVNGLRREVLDAATDRFHPIKHLRPVPSGKVSIPLAYAQWIALMLIGVGLGMTVSTPFAITLFVLREKSASGKLG